MLGYCLPQNFGPSSNVMWYVKKPVCNASDVCDLCDVRDVLDDCDVEDGRDECNVCESVMLMMSTMTVLSMIVPGCFNVYDVHVGLDDRDFCDVFATYAAVLRNRAILPRFRFRVPNFFPRFQFRFLPLNFKLFLR
jgi:hypothetical protein